MQLHPARGARRRDPRLARGRALTGARGSAGRGRAARDGVRGGRGTQEARAGLEDRARASWLRAASG